MNVESLPCTADFRLTDLRPTPDTITSDALAGLSRSPKRLPSKYFYDARGSGLFEAITRLPEYYLSRQSRNQTGDTITAEPMVR